jgi:hypothetical protein
VPADEIEFFVPDRPPPDAFGHREEIGGEPRALRRPTVDVPVTAAVVLLAAAAALPALASFRTVYTVRAGQGAHSGVILGADGWGRLLREVSGPSPLHGMHESRYGIVLVVCAAVPAVLAAVTLASLFPGPVRSAAPSVHGFVAVAALAASAVVGGVAASIGLELQATFDTLHAQLASIRDSGSGHGPHIDTSVGGCLWLALAGALAGLLGGGALLRARRPSAGDGA